MSATCTPPASSNTPIIEKRLHQVVEQGPVELEKRLDQLASKWTVGRISKVVIGLMVVTGLILGHWVSPWWHALSYVGGLLLLQYLVFPTSPLENFLKQFGVRTGTDITLEKVALKTLRGDFQEVPTIHKIEDRDAISRMEGEGGMALPEEDCKVDVKDAIPKVIEASALPLKVNE